MWSFYYKVWQLNFGSFFEIFRIVINNKVFLLQSMTDCYCKVVQILQSVTVITKWDVRIIDNKLKGSTKN